jgi:hypothetical protein
MPSILGTNTFEGSEVSISTSAEVDIAIVLDRSGSMAFAFDEISSPTATPRSAPVGWAYCNAAPPICRWRDLVAAMGVFVTELQNSPLDELASLSTYNQVAGTDVSLTSDYSTLLASLNPYTNSFCAGSTNIGGGISEGIGALQLSANARPFACKAILLMTDGIHNTGQDPVSAAYSAVDQGIVIYTITFANESDVALMQHVASISKGLHFHANSPADLVAAFREIARHLPTLLTK